MRDTDFFLIKEKFDRIYLQQDFSKEIIKIFFRLKKVISDGNITIGKNYSSRNGKN